MASWLEMVPHNVKVLSIRVMQFGQECGTACQDTPAHLTILSELVITILNLTEPGYGLWLTSSRTEWAHSHMFDRWQRLSPSR